MKKHYSLLTVFIVLMSLAVVCYGSESNTYIPSSIKKAQDSFGKSDVERFERMIQTGEFNLSFSTPSYQRATILHYAALTGDLNRVKELVKRGAAINSKYNCQKSVLHYAAESGNLELVQWLVEQGADVKDKRYHITVLHYGTADATPPDKIGTGSMAR